MRSIFNFFAIVLFVFVSTFYTSIIFAQTSEGIEEIVVTARKKEENIQETALSVSALSARDIENRFPTDIRDLAGNSLAADATGVEVALNEAPTVTDVEITGDLIAGQTLTGTYTFSDGNSDPESGSTYQWYMADDANGNNKAAISGATDAD